MQTLTSFIVNLIATCTARWALLPLLLLASVMGSRPVFGQGATFSGDAIALVQQPTAAPSGSTVNYAGTRKKPPYNGSTYLPLGTTSTTPVRTNPNAGLYDINGSGTSQLSFAGGSILASPPFDPDIPAYTGALVAARIQYRVYLNGSTTLPAFSTLPLNTTTPQGNSTIFSGTANINLLSGLVSGGAYTFEVVFQVDAQDNSTGEITTYNDPSASYQVNFNVSPPINTPPNGVTTWISNRDQSGAIQSPGSTLGVNDDWNNAGNWTNGIPNALSDAIIPGHSPTDPVTYRPSLNSNSANYSVRNLTLQNPSTADRAIVRIQAATLRIYGDLDNQAGGLLGGVRGNSGVPDPTQNSTLVFAGNNQLIRGLTTISDVRIEGSGVKGVVDALEAPNTLVIAPASASAGVILRTVFDNSFVLNTSKRAIVNLKDSGILSGETNTSFVEGILLADRPVVAGSTQTFGNIGLDFTPDQSSTGNLVVTRTVGVALNGPAGSTAKAVRRFYGVTGSYPTTTLSTLVFHYLDNPSELNGIDENNLIIFRTTNNGPPYSNMGGTVDVDANTVTRVGFAGVINTITLGDRTNPLPVQLISFVATRSGTNTVLNWATATEVNNKGFEVQVSTSGSSFRTLAFVASQSANSQRRLDYRYLDTEAGKTGVRYYRLHQIDLSGKDSYSSVRVVNFDGTASTAGSLTAYPNPFINNVVLSLESGITGGPAQVTIVDVTGRIVRQQVLTVDADATGLLSDLSDLRSGLYLAKVALADGSIRTVRIQKQ